MKTDTELEALLRSTLTGRAESVQDARPFVAPARAPRRIRPWVPALAAAAVVIVVAAGVWIGVRLTHSSRPVHPTPTPNGLHAVRCMVPLPNAWQSAIAAGTVTVAGHTVTPLAIDAAGDVIASEPTAKRVRYIRQLVPYAYRLVLITAEGSIRTLYDTSPPEAWGGMRIAGVSVERDWVAFAVNVGAASGGQGPVQLDVLNSATGDVRVIRPGPLDPTIVLGPAILHGSVYWTDILAGQALEYGPLYRYDIATGHRVVLDRHATSGPMVTGDAVYWGHGAKDGDKITSAGHGQPLPPDFDIAAAFGHEPVTDGRTVAWIDPITMARIMAWQPGMAAPVVVVPQRRSGNYVDGVTGHFLWWRSWRGSSAVVDLRTGAAVHLDLPSTMGGGIRVLVSGHLAVLPLAGSQLAFVDTAELPPLTC
jgi:hypothetical protein